MPEIPKVSLVNINEGSVPDNFQVISGLKVATTSIVAQVTGEGSVDSGSLDSGQTRQTGIADRFRPREVSSLAKLLALSLQKERSALKTHMMQDSHLDHQVVADPNAQVECAASSAQHAGVIASEDKQCDLDPTPKTQSVARPNLTQSQFPSLIIPDTDQPKVNISTGPSQTLQLTHPQGPNPTQLPHSETFPSLKQKPLPTDEVNQQYKKQKVLVFTALASFVDPPTSTSSPQTKNHHQLNRKRFKKKIIAGSVKLSSLEEKSDGYSSGATSSTNSLPNSEEGFKKPPPTQ